MEYQMSQTTESGFVEKSENFQQDTRIDNDSLRMSKFVLMKTLIVFILILL